MVLFCYQVTTAKGMRAFVRDLFKNRALAVIFNIAIVNISKKGMQI